MDEKKHIIVTGATSGIGAITARELAKEGNHVVIIGRSEAKCQATVAEIKEQTGQDVDYLLADFASPQSTSRVAQEYLEKYDRLDILINNAGTFFNNRSDVNGIEKTLMVNHLAPFMLTMALLPLLTQTAAASGQTGRIVNVNSDAHYSGINWDDIQYENGYPRMGTRAYGQSKAFNVLFTLELAKRIEGTGVTVNALHPGVVRTNIFNHAGPFIGVLAKMVIPFIGISAEEGAKTTLMLAQSPELEGVNGKYYSVLKEKRPLRDLRDEDVWAKAWTMTEEWVKQATN